MIEAGARCEKCSRIDTIPYTSETAVMIMLRQKGWKFKDKHSVCQTCAIKYAEELKEYL